MVPGNTGDAYGIRDAARQVTVYHQAQNLRDRPRFPVSPVGFAGS